MVKWNQLNKFSERIEVLTRYSEECDEKDYFVNGVDLFLFYFPSTVWWKRYHVGKGALFMQVGERSHLLDFMIVGQENDFFSIEKKENKVLIKGDNQINLARGLDWYCRYYPDRHYGYRGKNGFKDGDEIVFPLKKIVRKTELKKRYYLNYCTFSYSMVWWDWERWGREIDFMASKGINTPLMIVGMENVWKETSLDLGFSLKEVKEFISGPAFLAWWWMNNLEGWGGPLPDSWFEKRLELGRKMIKRMKDWGMEPVAPLFFGMVPRSFKHELEISTRFNMILSS